MPKGRKNPPSPPHRHGPASPPEWFLNIEDNLPINEFGAFLEQLGDKFRKNSEATISGIKIIPPKLCWTMVRYERMPRGELSLKIELIWEEKESQKSINKPSILDVQD